MKVTGDAVLHAPVEKVWEALLDPAILVRTIPGCERLETTGENTYAMTVTVGVAAIRGTYAGTCSLHDLSVPTSLKLSAEGTGAPGTIAADVDVRLTDLGDGTTSVAYDSEMSVGGMVAGVGQRMLGSVSRRLSAEFLEAVDDVLTGAAPALAAAGAEGPSGSMPMVYTDTARPGLAPRPQQDFLRGVAVGAGLVTLGVVLGSLVGRRR
jgi:carbon monoxide dehydrogenase subunit G